MRPDFCLTPDGTLTLSQSITLIFHKGRTQVTRYAPPPRSLYLAPRGAYRVMLPPKCGPRRQVFCHISCFNDIIPGCIHMVVQIYICAVLSVPGQLRRRIVPAVRKWSVCTSAPLVGVCNCAHGPIMLFLNSCVFGNLPMDASPTWDAGPHTIH